MDKLITLIVIFSLVFTKGDVNMADYNIQMGQRNSQNTEWDNHYPFTKARNVKTISGRNVQDLDLESNLYYFNILNGLQSWRGKINQGLKNVLVIGDSITEGYYAENKETKGYAFLIKSKLQSLYGNGGSGYVALYKSGWTLTGTWTALGDYGAFGSCKYASGIANKAFIVLSGDNFDIHVVDSGTSTFTVQIDSETPKTFTTGNTNKSVKFNIQSSTNAEHTITITAPATGNVYLLGISANIGNTGCRVHNVGKSGGSMTDLTYSKKEEFIEPLQPDLTILAMGTNDFTTQRTLVNFRAAAIEVIQKAKTYGDVLIIAPCHSSITDKTISQKEYEQVLIDLAKEYNCGFISIYDAWINYDTAFDLKYMYDNIHPNTAGHEAQAKAILKHIIN